MRKIYAEKKGFSLSETLVAMLLLSIVLSAVTAGITAVRNSYLKIIQKADAMTLLSTIAISMEADLSSAQNVEELSEGGYRFKSGARGYAMQFDTVNDMISVVAQDSIDGDIIIPVTTDAGHTKDLCSELTSITYNNVERYFEYTITIKSRPKGVDASRDILSQNYVTRVED